ncbi:MAG: pentapeptide repeat-containing protein [Proteobacteria bacterium]|nr:pentapeptide repeat-containing protein [Pseudomonadota bacterium]
MPAPATERKSLSQSELEAVITAHERYLARQSGGQRGSFAFHDISHLHLSNRNLSEADFSGAKARFTAFTGAKLINANLFAADLRVANLEGADLSGADLRGACLRGAVLNDAILIKADLREGVLGRSGENRKVNYVTFDSSPADLVNVVAQRANLSFAKLSNAFVIQTDFSDAIMHKVRLTGADKESFNKINARV